MFDEGRKQNEKKNYISNKMFEYNNGKKGCDFYHNHCVCKSN